MVLKIFTQPKCPKCPAAKELGKKIQRKIERVKLEYWDTSTVDGLTEASFYSVMSTPSLVLCNDHGKEIKSWRGEVPKADAITKLVSRWS